MSDSSKKKTGINAVKRAALYLVGNVILCGAAFIAIPKITPYISSAIFKHMLKNNNNEENNDRDAEAPKECPNTVDEEE